MATKYINADTGNDTTGNGTSSLPYLTLAKGLATTSAGDTIYCQNSTATYAFANATLTNRTIRGQSTDGVVFDAANTDKSWGVGTGTTVIDHISIQNVGTAGGSRVITWAIATSPTLTVTSCKFRNIVCYGENSGGGVIGHDSYSAGLTTVTIQGCIFDNINFVGLNYSGYFSMRGSAAGSTFNFFNNVFFLKTVPTGTVDGIFEGFNDGNNITWNLKNSIFRNVAGGSYSLAGSYVTGAKVTLTNCSYTGFWLKAGVITVNCQTSDPLLIDGENSNFRLRPTSPCLGAGTIL